MENKAITTKKTNHTARYKLAAILLLSFTASFMFFIFSPLSLYLRSPSSFAIGLNFLLPWFLVFAFAAFAMLSIVLILLWKIKALKDKAINCALLLVFGCTIASYVQLLFLNGRMVVLGEDMTTYSILNFANIFNLLIWILIAISPLVLWLIFRKLGKEIRIAKPLVFISAVILCMQIGELSVAIITTPRTEEFNNNVLRLTLDPMMNLSSEENIVVFLPDSFNTEFLLEVLEASPELKYQLDGFTLYTNNVANFRKTFPAITTMLTQHYYGENTLFSDFFEDAWSQYSYINTLRENGFVTNFHISQDHTFGSFENLIGNADNLKIEERTNININVSNIFVTTTRLTAGRFAPYLMKEFFLLGIDSLFGNGFFEFLTHDFTPQLPNLGNVGGMRFYEFISQNTLYTDNSNSVFNFVHLIGAHIGSRLSYDAEIGSIFFNSDNDNESAVRATLHIINTYLDNLRESGVYDNTTVIILTDHVLEQGPAHTTTTLLIKPKGASGRLEFNHEAELSNKYLGASVLQIAGLPHEHLGLSFFDIINGAPPPPRVVYWHSLWPIAVQEGSNAIELERTYMVTGDANNRDNWVLVDN